MRLVLLLVILICHDAWAQSEYHFTKLTVEDGLSDAHVQAIGQDKFGFVWFGSLSGVSRFDGRNITLFSHDVNDSTSILSEMAMSFGSDTEGRFFIGFANGLAEFDFRNHRFRRVAAAKNKHITSITAVRKDLLLLTTTEGLFAFNPSTYAWRHLNHDSLLTVSCAGAFFKNELLYLASNKGLVVYDTRTERATKIPIAALEGAVLRSVVVDDRHNVWVTAHGKTKIHRIAPDFSKVAIYDADLKDNEPSASSLLKLVIDPKGRVFIGTKFNGLLEYLPEIDHFVRHIHNPDKQWSFSNAAVLSLFCDREGIVWGGTGGICFFHPDRNLFTTIMPHANDLSVRQRRYARCVTEDKDGNLWLGTRDGLVKYDVKTQRRRTWRNEGAAANVLSANIILGLYCDEANNIWIGTTQGLNFYNRKTDKIELLSGKNGFPNGTFKFFYKDPNGTFWICLLDENGLGFLGNDQKWHSCREIPGLERFAGLPVWTMMQDRKGRFWYAFDEKGVGMYDPKSQKTDFWSASTEGAPKLAGNINVDIKEDSRGIIWIGSFGGLTQLDYDRNAVKVFKNDLLKSAAYGLHIDRRDRVWISTGSGLVIMDSSRAQFSKFGISDGLPSLEFTEEASFQTASGTVILPTMNGFVAFDPMRFANQKEFLNAHIATFSANGVAHTIPNDDEATIHIDLDADENAFTFDLVAVNYLNPSQVWFAYKLDGFDRDWHYTQDPKAVYTNVPGGNYTFRYKATLNPNDWDFPEKSVSLHLDTVFYKAWWFWGVLLGLATLGIFQFYRYRERQRQQVFDLLSKAQLLEKEKAVMQYEGLKQQLNPHFLFNSLASLSSLIQIDPSVATGFLENLSKTYRYILKSSEHEIVPVRDEMRFTQNFVELQKVRFETGLEVHFKVDEADFDRKIVPVTLQNMIENAIKHNIIDDESPLKIEIYTEGGYLLVKNNLQKKNFVETSNKRGLANLTSLYRYLSNQPLTTEETSDSFIVKIPLI